MTILDVKSLTVDYLTQGVRVRLLNQINFKVAKNTIVGITGVSGSGKSMTALSILGLNNDNINLVTNGSVLFRDQDLMTLSESEWNKFRNKKISIIFQNPEAALNPAIRCGLQILEAIHWHQPSIALHDAKKRVEELLAQVGFEDIVRIYKSYPSELSGGQQQRIVIAISIANQPELIIADEATSSLDVQTSSNIIELLLSFKKTIACAIIFITHDIRLLRAISDQIILMRDGSIVSDFKNDAESLNLLNTEAQAYLQLSLPAISKEVSLVSDTLILDIEDIGKIYRTGGLFFGRSQVEVLKNVSFKLYQGRVLGFLGKTGSGKTTLGNILAGTTDATSGVIKYKGEIVDCRTFDSDPSLRRNVQLILQDSYTSFDPRQSVREVLQEVIYFYALAKGEKKIGELLAATLHGMGLSEDILSRNTSQLSGGQRQRLSIARAMLLKPEIIIFDESLSALDIQNQVNILTLIKDLQLNFAFSAIFISHDPEIIRYISTELIVLDQGKIVEKGKTADLFKNPVHEVTKRLIGRFSAD